MWILLNTKNYFGGAMASFKRTKNFSWSIFIIHPFYGDCGMHFVLDYQNLFWHFA